MVSGYCASRGGWMVLAMCQAFLLPLVCWLYGLPLRPVFYALILMGSVLLLFIALDFWRFAGRIRNLETKRQQAPFEAWELSRPWAGGNAVCRNHRKNKIRLSEYGAAPKEGKGGGRPILRTLVAPAKRRWRQSSCFCRRNIRTETRWSSLCFRRSSM